MESEKQNKRKNKNKTKQKQRMTLLVPRVASKSQIGMETRAKGRETLGEAGEGMRSRESKSVAGTANGNSNSSNNKSEKKRGAKDQNQKSQIMETKKASHQKAHKILILDWDNTILPSDYLQHHGYKLDNKANSNNNNNNNNNMNGERPLPKEMSELQMQVCKFLSVAIQELSYDNVIIITNAEKGWVELSALQFLPQCVPWLKHLHIISARSMFEATYPQPFQWKHRCMHFIMQKCWQATLPYLDSDALKLVMKKHMQSYFFHLHSLFTQSRIAQEKVQGTPNSTSISKESEEVEKEMRKDTSESDKENGQECFGNENSDNYMCKTSTYSNLFSLLASQQVKRNEEFISLQITSLRIKSSFNIHIRIHIHVCTYIRIRREEQKEKEEEEKEMIEEQEKRKNYHIISVGDSWAERNACLVFGDILSNVYVKSVKLREKPSILQVIQQLQLLTVALPLVIAQDSNLDYFMPLH
ncbi:hypothetical protein RFI_29932 [Reticulomyxa filosa]|uniref:Uncharacterized protein n=1 Tax=Reticulomyxa filosa TaxID=46433 RepID=X6M360_RETFI|nr:hypothetical protein RFI_29932 [Reticulomyxa filosa]|eukprot:ETO07460.1 hypothetical protein RFI_29932 [Reticulomyxa filosa]